MSHKEAILAYLERREDTQMCDDCLSEEVKISPRQTVYQVCNRLARKRVILRRKDLCSKCRKFKLVNRMIKKTPPRSTESTTVNVVGWNPQDDWFWEGNVQKQIVAYLESQGWKMVSVSDTASRETGPDILATRDEHKLRISVKGWPSDKYVSGPKKGQIKPTRPYNQARHGFAQAIFELMLQPPMANLRLALGFPDNKVYRDLWTRTRWALSQLRISCFFVSDDDSVEEAL